MTLLAVRIVWFKGVVFASFIGLLGCSSPTVSDYANNTPEFSLAQFFSGHLTAQGILKNRSGKVIRYFNADLHGEWVDGVGTLKEDFVFDDGEKQQRTWTMTPNENGQYIATANDVIGYGVTHQSGNALFMNYVLRVPYNDDSLDVSVDDRMYRVNENVVINESTLSKFGFEVGYLTLVITKVTAPE
ncbi:DUF3833 domain-containing protein [Marinomonas pollencensis]|uniref:Uncharacterized protein DUF3833 n=1 Tax=Marinomonas pollencensis TaxID=491954 RepID=A0A3E0DIC6_9GAMM|nr:DUF3833 domain-containing protein [Marinomonas pollencensis]REG82402.1 uncharacterized protein DUF3833 [Marinomonas pollencensis]